MPSTAASRSPSLSVRGLSQSIITLAAQCGGLIDGSGHPDRRQLGRLTPALRACRAESCQVSNHILSRLSRDDLGLLEPHLQAVDLPVRKELASRNKRVEHVYFPESGMMSVVANGQQAIEIGIIGREGMTGLSVVLDSNGKATHETFVQIAGNGHRLSAKSLREAIEVSGTLHKAMLRYAHTFMTQTAETAAANGRHNIVERLARWLLMANDRMDGPEVPLTHEFLGVMIGTSRPGVTIALNELERRGWITHRRGVVTIIDRGGLVTSSRGAYVAQNDD